MIQRAISSEYVTFQLFNMIIGLLCITKGQKWAQSPKASIKSNEILQFWSNWSCLFKIKAILLPFFSKLNTSNPVKNGL